MKRTDYDLFRVEMAVLTLEREWAALRYCVLRQLERYPHMTMWEASRFVTSRAFNRKLRGKK